MDFRKCCCACVTIPNPQRPPERKGAETLKKERRTLSAFSLPEQDISSLVLMKCREVRHLYPFTLRLEGRIFRDFKTIFMV